MNEHKEEHSLVLANGTTGIDITVDMKKATKMPKLHLS